MAEEPATLAALIEAQAQALGNQPFLYMDIHSALPGSRKPSRRSSSCAVNPVTGRYRTPASRSPIVRASAAQPGFTSSPRKRGHTEEKRTLKLVSRV